MRKIPEKKEVVTCCMSKCQMDFVDLDDDATNSAHAFVIKYEDECKNMSMFQWKIINEIKTIELVDANFNTHTQLKKITYY